MCGNATLYIVFFLGGAQIMEFSTLDIERLHGYSYASKYVYRDKSLSLKAMGFLSLLYSLPDDWEFTEKGFTFINSDGLSSVRSVIKELKEKEYLTVDRIRSENGQLKGTTFHVFQMPYSLNREAALKAEFKEITSDENNNNLMIEEVPVTIMSNYHLRDNSLSLKAKGLLSLLFSLPPKWFFTEKALAALCSDGVSSVQAAIKELKEHNYITIDYRRDERGRIAGSLYTIFRMPKDMPRTVHSPICDFPVAVNPYTDKPKMDSPKQGSPKQENETEIKTNSIKTINNKNFINKQQLENKYGKYENIQLLSSEYEKLKSLYPEKFEKALNIASENIRTGTNCSNIYNYIVGIIEKMPARKETVRPDHYNDRSYDLDKFSYDSVHSPLVYKK